MEFVGAVGVASRIIWAHGIKSNFITQGQADSNDPLSDLEAPSQGRMFAAEQIAPDSANV